MKTQPEWEKADREPVLFDEAESRVIDQIANWYADNCRRRGQPLPKTPLHAVVAAAAELMYAAGHLTVIPTRKH